MPSFTSAPSAAMAWALLDALTEPLPRLLAHPDAASRPSSPDPTEHVLDPAHVHPWPSFRTDVADALRGPVARAHSAHPPACLPSVPVRRETFVVATATGVAARFVQNVAHAVNEMVACLPALPPVDAALDTVAPADGRDADATACYLADCPPRHSLAAAHGGELPSRLPDVAILCEPQHFFHDAARRPPRRCRPPPQVPTPPECPLAGVGEVATPWSDTVVAEDVFGQRPGATGAVDVPGRQRLATKLGHLARCMDDTGLRFGFFTTYDCTVFVRRDQNHLFRLSPPVYYDDVPANRMPTVRACFLALMLMTKDQSLSRYPCRVGVELVHITARYIYGRLTSCRRARRSRVPVERG